MTLKFSVTASVQFSLVAQSYLTLYDPLGCSTPGLPVHHQLPEFTQTHIHWVSDAIQPSHPLSSPSPPWKTQIHIKSCLIESMTSKIFVEKFFVTTDLKVCIFFFFLPLTLILACNFSLFIIYNIGGTWKFTQIIRISQWFVVQSLYMNCWVEFGWLEKAMAPHSSTLARKIHGRRSLVGCSPWGH